MIRLSIKGVFGSTSTLWVFPLMDKRIILFSPRGLGAANLAALL
jgi:hypothetical protein